MAIYHLTAKTINRSDGRSATAAAAYRAGCEIVDARTGEIHNYTTKTGVVHAEIFAPEQSPNWATDRASLWNNVELAEKRKDAQVAREVEVALPVELSLFAHKDLVNEFVNLNFVRQGMIADVAIHYPNKGTAENPHAHIMLTTRTVTPDGFGNKNRDWNDKEVLETWRKSWADITNKHLIKHGSIARIDNRSLKAQGIDRLPLIKMGAAATQMERRGIKTDRGDINRWIARANKTCSELTEEIKGLYEKTRQAVGKVKDEWRAWNDYFTKKETQPQHQPQQAQVKREPEKPQSEWSAWNKVFGVQKQPEPEKVQEKEQDWGLEI